MTQLHDDVVGLDSAIFQHHTTWKASGHVDHFSDPMVDCIECNARHRADKLIEDFVAANPDVNPGKPVDTMTHDEMKAFIDANINCPTCGSKTANIQQFASSTLCSRHIRDRSQTTAI